MKQSFQQFCLDTDKHICRVFRNLLDSAAVSEQAVLSTPLQRFTGKDVEDKGISINSQIVIRFPRLFTLRSLIKYSILSWYVPVYTRVLLQEVLEKKAVQLHFPEVRSYLYSKEYMLANLFLETDYRLNEIFGNILIPGVIEIIKTSEGKSMRVPKSDKLFISYCNPGFPRRKVYKRGYNDHGSMPPGSLSIIRKEVNKDISLNILQEKLERIKSEETLLYLKNIEKLARFLYLEGRRE